MKSFMYAAFALISPETGNWQVAIFNCGLAKALEARASKSMDSSKNFGEFWFVFILFTFKY